MFKRVTRKIEKQKKEEALGLDSEMKEVLGLQDTDSDESDSSEDDSDEPDDSSEDEDGDLSRHNRHHNGRKPQQSYTDEENTESEARVESGSEGELLDQDSADEDEEDQDESENGVPLSLEDAVEDPIYLVSLEPDMKACITCPGKLLKSAPIVEVHLASGAHKRRFLKFLAIAKRRNSIEDVLAELNAGPSLQKPADGVSGQLSKRAVKRKAKLDAIKARRQRHKKGKARSIAKKQEKTKSTTKSVKNINEVDSTKPGRGVSKSKSQRVKEPQPKTAAASSTESSLPKSKKRKAAADSVATQTTTSLSSESTPKPKRQKTDAAESGQESSVTKKVEKAMKSDKLLNSASVELKTKKKLPKSRT